MKTGGVVCPLEDSVRSHGGYDRLPWKRRDAARAYNVLS